MNTANQKTPRYWAIAMVAALGLGLSACGGGGDGGLNTTQEQTLQEEKKAAEEQAADLREQIAELRKALGLDADGNLGESVEELTNEVNRLRNEKQAREDMDANEMAKEKADEARKLALGLDESFTVDALTVTAKYGKTATLAGDSSTGFFSDADTAEPTFKDKDSTSIAALGGWSGTELMSKPKSGPNDIVRVYTNVDSGKRVPFEEWAGVTTGVDLTNGAITIAAVHATHIRSSAFASGSGSKPHKGNTNTDADPDLEAFVTGGTFAGASGTYRCVLSGTTPCQSAVADDKGGITLSAGTWTFTPNTDAMAQVPDSNYQHFGWWLRKADDGYSVNVFAGETGGPTGALTLTALGGTATYTGNAAGKYSIYDSGPKGGHFTASVELKADFGTATEDGSVSGKIDKFVGDTAGMDTWVVTLPKLNLASGGAGTFAAADTGAITTAERPVWSIDGRAGGVGNGQWGGSLHAVNSGGTPMTAVGTFTAEYDLVGNIKGAFGANHSGP